MSIDNKLGISIIDIPPVDKGAWYDKELESLAKGELSSFVQEKLKAFPLSRHCGRTTKIGIIAGSIGSVLAIGISGGVTIWVNTDSRFSKLAGDLISNLTTVALSSIFGGIVGYVTTGCLPVCTSDKANNKQNAYSALTKHFEQMRYRLLTHHKIGKSNTKELEAMISKIDSIVEQLGKYMKKDEVNCILMDFKVTLEYVANDDGKYNLNRFEDQKFRAFLMLYENMKQH